MTSPRPCPSPLSSETLRAYRARELPADEMERVELHLRDCDACSAGSRPRVVTLRVIDGQRKDPPRPAAPAPGQRWFLATAGAAALAAAVALYAMLPRGAEVATMPLRRGGELSPPADARSVRLVPELDAQVTADGARLRSVDGDRWLDIRVESGPPLAVVAARGDLVPGRYDLELVMSTPGGEESRGVYRFRVTEPAARP